MERHFIFVSLRLWNFLEDFLNLVRRLNFPGGIRVPLGRFERQGAGKAAEVPFCSLEHYLFLLLFPRGDP